MQVRSPVAPIRRSTCARLFEPIGTRGQIQRPAAFVVQALLRGKAVPLALRGSGAWPAPGSLLCLRWVVDTCSSPPTAENCGLP
eukprot:5743174-Alexandrium_andersonii.AAC.1